MLEPSFHPLDMPFTCINNVLYGLNSYGARSHYRISDDLTALGLVPSMGGCDTCMLNKGDYYYYVDWYCDDIIVVHKDPGNVFDSITEKEFIIKEASDTD